MKTILGMAILAILATATVETHAAQSSNPKAAQSSGNKAQASASASKAASDQSDETGRADLYYYFAMGHLNEQQYELTGRSEQAAESIDFYKKALALQPGSPVIMERLAEIYAKSQRVRDAVAQAQEVLKIDPNSLAAHRLLARIYVRTLGDANAGELQKENLAKAVEQFNAILKLDPRRSNN
jgi:tetratricopeptide (TPR) repeat protein